MNAARCPIGNVVEVFFINNRGELYQIRRWFSEQGRYNVTSARRNTVSVAKRNFEEAQRLQRLYGRGHSVVLDGTD